ncbi:MAG: RHS repeat protein, partial [Clostridia bacterium]|nr:RHS repeat protein [Clostridia bacterium]
YDEEGNLASVTVSNVTDNDGNTTDITTSYTYDDVGRPITVTDANGNITATEYDARGRTVKVTNPDGSYIEYIYDLVNNVTTADHSAFDAAIYDYDSLGHLETTRYADGTVISENFYDENGRLVAEATNRGSGAASTTYYTYDVFDRVTEKIVYDMNNVLVYRETYEYNDVYTSTLSLVTKTVHGDENAADIVTKAYINKYGETVKEDVGGVVTEYEYDYVSNPIRVYYDDTTLATYTYDHAGNVTSETNALEDTRTITYDALGRKTSESDYKGNITNYTYDAAGRLLTMTAPFADGVNTTVKYYYDANGNVTKQQQTAQADNSTEVVWRTVEYEYDEMNRVTDIINHVSDTSKQYTHYAYDAAGNLTHVYTGMTQPWTAAMSNSAYRLVTYGYDGRGNNTAVTDAVNKTEKYTYDVLGMLTATELRNDTDFSYIYSPLGMIADSVKVGNDIVSSSTTEYTATGAVRSVTLDGATVSYTYDGLGNVLTETEGQFVKTYTYDNRGRKSGYTLTRNGGVKSTATY